VNFVNLFDRISLVIYSPFCIRSVIEENVSTSKYSDVSIVRTTCVSYISWPLYTKAFIRESRFRNSFRLWVSFCLGV
jgi:hypothetical protein